MFSNICDILCLHYCALTPIHDSVLVLAAKVRIHTHFNHSLCIVMNLMRVTSFWYLLIY